MRLPLFASLVVVACGGIETFDGGRAQDAGEDRYWMMDGSTVADGADARASDAGGDGGPFDPGKVPGLVLWLDGSYGVTQDAMHVVGWSDRSGNNNNAAQTMSALQPAYVLQAVNGLPCARFDYTTQEGQVLVVQDAPTLQFGTGDFLIEIVARYDNQPTALPSMSRAFGAFYVKADFTKYLGIFFFGNSTSGETEIQAQMSATWFVSTPTGGYNDGKARAYGLRRAGASMEIRVNGAAAAAINGSGDLSAKGFPLDIGAAGSQMGYKEASVARLDGDICEVIAVKGTVSSADLGGIESYLMTKYKL